MEAGRSVPPVWTDSRVVAGMSEQLNRRRAALAAGERPLGWKLAFGSPDAAAALGLGGPVVGYLTDATSIDPRKPVDVGGWSRPMLEAELGLRIGEDVLPGASATAGAAAIEAIGPAIELADIDRPREQLTEVVGSNIYHRGVLFAPTESMRPGSRSDDLSAVVTIDGREVARCGPPEQVLGRLGYLVAHVADYLGASGLRLEAGATIISGSIVPLLPLQQGVTVRYVLAPIGELELRSA